MIFVRALWGDPSVCTYRKALVDVEHRSGRLPDSVDLRIVAYGEHNADFLDSLGYEKEIIFRKDELPAEYHELGADRPTPISKRRPGTVVDGVMMWWHKLAAIRTVMLSKMKPEPVVWLDWDTKILRQPDQELCDLLAAGPAFQSAQCPWKNSRAPWRTGENAKWAFHGGCYYIREFWIIDRAIALHAEIWSQYSDETVLTWIADHELAGQPCENPRLYRCRKHKPGLDVSQAYFCEGDVMHWKDVKK